MNVVPIVFAFDENLIMPAGVCITSLLENAHEETFYDIYILHSSKINFEDTLLNNFPTLYSNCKITFRSVDAQFEQSYEVRGITNSTYYRLLIPEIIHEYDKILYSDVDVIFRDDLLSVYQTNIEDYYLAGVDNCSFIRPNMQEYISKELNLDYNRGYYYAGNLIINSALIRKDKIVTKFKELAHNKYKQQDMDIINIVCNGRIKSLSPAFCLTNYLCEIILKNRKEMLSKFTEDELQYALEKGIVHYNGQKPWKGGCVNFDIWWEYYRKSPFFNQSFYFDFFNRMLNEHDYLPLRKRIKILIRFFIYGRRQD